MAALTAETLACVEVGVLWRNAPSVPSNTAGPSGGALLWVGEKSCVSTRPHSAGLRTHCRGKKRATSVYEGGMPRQGYLSEHTAPRALVPYPAIPLPSAPRVSFGAPPCAAHHLTLSPSARPLGISRTFISRVSPARPLTPCPLVLSRPFARTPARTLARTRRLAFGAIVTTPYLLRSSCVRKCIASSRQLRYR